MASSKNILGCSSTTSNIAFITELGMYPRETNGDVRKLIMTIYSKGYARNEVASHT